MLLFCLPVLYQRDLRRYSVDPALQAEIDAKALLITQLEAQLDAALAEATQAEALVRTTRTEFEEASAGADAARQIEKDKARTAYERALSPAASQLAKAEAELAAEEKGTQAAISRQTAQLRSALANVKLRERRALDEAAAIQKQRDDDVLAIQTESQGQVAQIQAKIDQASKLGAQNKNAVGASLIFAAISGFFIVGDQLRLGFVPALAGAGSAVALFLFFATDKFETESL